ncbi:Rhomboid protein 2 [Ophiocordyceps camponoti-floridani]|uniref:Rhomboid protein 2 n=1 Tax=Ophiocordyceps camponoti-floridani TaxID=2030778 RepID=A0A8H4Q976_9HYPO|nr:Rhomboid protein 2 [Ophiocordyceps camponoti-floridani]
MPTARVFGVGRLRSLPLFTRFLAVAIAIFWVAGLPPAWGVRAWAALVPDKISFKTAYRLSTFPLVHLNIIHAAINMVALTPLMERFENEHGTLTTISLFFGPLTTLPALLYLLIERGVLRSNSIVMGSSIWDIFVARLLDTYLV